MTDSILSDSDLAKLRALDTPTICNALEIVPPARRGIGFTTKPLVCARPHLPPIVGYARTATIRAIHPAESDAKAMRQRRLDYYRHVSEGPAPRIVLLEDLDAEPGYGAFWGEVNSNIHKGLGCLGVVTNGSIRDIPACAEGFQLLAGTRRSVPCLCACGGDRGDRDHPRHDRAAGGPDPWRPAWRRRDPP